MLLGVGNRCHTRLASASLLHNITILARLLLLFDFVAILTKSMLHSLVTGSSVANTCMSHWGCHLLYTGMISDYFCCRWWTGTQSALMDGNCQGPIRPLPGSFGPGVPPPCLTSLLDYKGPFPTQTRLLTSFPVPIPRPSTRLLPGTRSDRGFRIGFNRASPLRSSRCNHPPSLEQPQIIDHHFSSEVQSG